MTGRQRPRKFMFYPKTHDIRGEIHVVMETVTGRTSEFYVEKAGGVVNGVSADSAWVKADYYGNPYRVSNVADLMKLLKGKLFKDRDALLKEAAKRRGIDAVFHGGGRDGEV